MREARAVPPGPADGSGATGAIERSEDRGPLASDARSASEPARRRQAGPGVGAIERSEDRGPTAGGKAPQEPPSERGRRSGGRRGRPSRGERSEHAARRGRRGRGHRGRRRCAKREPSRQVRPTGPERREQSSEVRIAGRWQATREARASKPAGREAGRGVGAIERSEDRGRRATGGLAPQEPPSERGRRSGGRRGRPSRGERQRARGTARLPSDARHARARAVPPGPGDGSGAGGEIERSEDRGPLASDARSASKQARRARGGPRRRSDRA